MEGGSEEATVPSEVSLVLRDHVESSFTRVDGKYAPHWARKKESAQAPRTKRPGGQGRGDEQVCSRNFFLGNLPRSLEGNLAFEFLF